jgi:hypothetical protein
MAKIEIERKPERNPWPLVLGLVRLVAVGAAIWWFALRDRMAGPEMVMPGDTAAAFSAPPPPPAMPPDTLPPDSLARRDTM